MSAIKFNVSITAAGRVTRNSGDSLASVQEGQFTQVGGGLYEVMTSSGSDFTIDDWTGGAITAGAKIVPTLGNVNVATEQLRAVSVFANSLLGQLEDYSTGTGTTDIVNAAGVTTTHETISQQKLTLASLFNAFGLGSSGVNVHMPNNDVDDIIANGIYRTTSASGANEPFNDIGQIIHAEQSGGFAAQLAIRTNTKNELKLRQKKSGAWDTDWTYVFTSENTNLDEFSGNAIGDCIGIGSAAGTNNAIIYLPINSKITPTSITVVGQFRIIDVKTGNVRGSATPIISSQSSNKFCVVVVPVAGMTPGDFVSCQLDSATSKITVNF